MLHFLDQTFGATALRRRADSTSAYNQQPGPFESGAFAGSAASSPFLLPSRLPSLSGRADLNFSSRPPLRFLLSTFLSFFSRLHEAKGRWRRTASEKKGGRSPFQPDGPYKSGRKDALSIQRASQLS